MATSPTQAWELVAHQVRHRVEVAGSFVRVVRWYADGELVASAQTYGDRIRIRPGDRLRGGRKDVGRSELGVLEVRFTATGRSRRVTAHPAEGGTAAQVMAELGLSGLDLDPEPGSAAARRDERFRRHPRRSAAVATVGGAAKVLVPVLLALLAVRMVPDIPWPDVDLPALPLPDLPALPRPDVQLPRWVGQVAGVLQYAWPVLLAPLLVWVELRRRRRQDELKARLRAEAGVRSEARTRSEA